MSKINCFRIINLNYNNNAIRIEDETFHLDGESTLLSLQNGGGKSVLVQMLTAPFVRKRYRDTTNRPFASYFTTNKPTFLLIEWALDGSAGYVLTGMMVRKKLEDKDDTSNEELDMVNFIYEYKAPNDADIHEFPVVEIKGSEKILKGFSASKQIFENLKKEKGRKFQYFDMNQSAQQKQYFELLKEYQINHNEWESIIKKVNLKESGLSELFKDAKDEAGLVEKWFLPAVESKLNNDQNRMKEFASILYKYILQYKENQSKIQRKEKIQLFEEEASFIRDNTMHYVDEKDNTSLYEEKIAYLRDHLQELLAEATERYEETEEELQKLEDKIQTINYEESSYHVYCHMEELEKLTKGLEIQKEEKEKIQKVIDNLTFKLNTLHCARLYEDYKDRSKDVLYLENKLEVLKNEEKDLLPERNQIGYNLRIRYEEEYGKEKNHILELEEFLRNKQEEKVNLSNKEEKEQIELGELGRRLGIYQTKVNAFDKVEMDFNHRYRANLGRNILGVYEEGTLEILSKNFEETYHSCVSELTHLKEKKEQVEENITSCSRDIEDKSSELGGFNSTIQTRFKQLEDYNLQLESRKDILRFIGLKEDKLFELAEVFQTFDKKLKELNEIKRLIQREKEDLEEEYKKLETGKVLELPKDFGALLDKNDISYVFGMDWLKKNSNTQEENQKLLSQNPMIPYSIIMSERELNKLAESQVDFFTSFPIPIIKREDLASNNEFNSSCLYETERLSFFVVFNHHLLDEEGLKALLLKKTSHIDKCKKQLLQKSEEIKEYEDKRNQIQYQSVNEGDYKECKKAIDELQEKIEKLENAIFTLRNRKGELSKEKEDLDKTITDKSEQESFVKSEIYDFKNLCKSYEEYMENRTEIEKTEKAFHQLQESIKENKLVLQTILQELQDTITNRERVLIKVEKLQQKVNFFQSYREGELLSKDTEDLEARYEAITKNISESQSQLEEELQKARERFLKAQERLLTKATQVGLEEQDYIHVVVDDYLEKECITEQKDKEHILQDTVDKINSLTTDIAVKESKIETTLERMEEQFHTRELCPRNQILDLEFKKRIRLIRVEMDAAKLKQKEYDQKVNSYQNNLSSLAEFNNLTTDKRFDFEEELFSFGSVKNIEELSNQDLVNFRGKLIRDYRVTLNAVQKKREELLKLLDSISHKTSYQEEFFQKPIDTLISLVDAPNVLLEQLDIILASYIALIEKLDVDIALIYKEKEKVLEMLLDYVGDVHKNLGKIDKNSSITVRGRTIKMLKLKLPVWEEQEVIYKTRLEDFIETTTNQGLKRLEQNENIEEMLGTLITTKNLYNTIVGIGNIDIKLYKIEAQREYPISWAQVARNSGGEGFLSAFVVLSSLLSFMRREDTDLFYQQVEGKVLLMDNPFAQTNASHLLIPLMDIAKKNNTQLICLTGLGGESIYNRFDNIYVLNLMESGLQRDVQYLKGEHIKGDEPILTIYASQVKVEDAEQMELLF